MSRLSIELPDHQHQQIKALAAIHGQSLKDFIVEKTLQPVSDVASEIAADGTEDEKQALHELMDFLAPRIESARRGDFSKLSIKQIIAKAKARRKN